jgi:acetyltransferase-like isoleucine patch superfamily enzyme
MLRLCGAQIGRNVRIYEIQLFNLESGFTNLRIGDDVHIGPGCRLDLAGPIQIHERSTLSPGVTILTHSDPGSSHGSKLVGRYPPLTSGVNIGSDCWLGANTILLAGVTIGDLTVIAAGSVVTTSAPSGSLMAGVPAKEKKQPL